jgi:PPM family protein phosphatase
MRYTVVAETDIGIRKNINQDSVLVKHAETELGEILQVDIFTQQKNL